MLSASEERVSDGPATLRGRKFPVALVSEGLGVLVSIDGGPDLAELHSTVLQELERRYEASGFHYFDDPVVPPDLDTASSLVRALHPHHDGIVEAYATGIAKNRQPNGLVATWWGRSQRVERLCGRNAVHLDVMLNSWLSDVELGWEVDPELVLRTVERTGLRNYWYLPSAYTRFLLSRLVTRFQPDVRGQFEALHALENAAEHRYGESSVEAVQVPPPVSALARQHGEGILNEYFRVASLCVHSPERGARELLGLSPIVEIGDEPLYWSIGFSTFASRTVARSLAVVALAQAARALGVFPGRHREGLAVAFGFR